MRQNKQHTLFGECLAEFIGTGLLIFFGVGCVAALVLTGAEFGQWEVSIIWGFGAAIAIYCTAGVSGAHINPAVTIALPDVAFLVLALLLVRNLLVKLEEGRE